MRGLIVKLIMISLAAASTAAESGETVASEPVQPRIEAVFVLDTTGSMGGLISAAKEKIWAIANTLAMTEPAPDIRMGLIGYRDRSDEYVTKKIELTEDLDAVYEFLMKFQAQGGGDTPESVNQALHEAVTQMKWSTDEYTYRVIFLVGDCPPHMDYKDDVKYPASCKLAAERGIVINTIQCGSHAATVPIWGDIARRAEGGYFRVEQSGGAILASTPFDTELAKLSRKFDETRIYYGSAEEQARQEARSRRADKLYEDASSSAVAGRAVFNAKAAGKANFAGTKELVSDLDNGRVELSELETDELDEKMQKMTSTEREEYIRGMSTRRKNIQAQIEELAGKRQKYIQEQIQKTNLKNEQSLDWSLYKCIKTQAGKKNIVYEEGPTY